MKIIQPPTMLSRALTLLPLLSFSILLSCATDSSSTLPPTSPVLADTQAAVQTALNSAGTLAGRPAANLTVANLPGSAGANAVIVISGFTNVATGNLSGFTVAVTAPAGYTFTGGATEATIMLANNTPPIIATNIDTNTLTVTPDGGEAVTYTVRLAIGGAAIASWLTQAALDANTYFDPATFNGQAFTTQTLTAGADGTNTLTLGGLANAADGEVVLTTNANFPAGFTVTGLDMLRDPDGAGVGATNGSAGTFTLADTVNAANTQTYDVVVELSEPSATSVAMEAAVRTALNNAPLPAGIPAAADLAVTVGEASGGGGTITISGITNVATGSLPAFTLAVAAPAGYTFTGGATEATIMLADNTPPIIATTITAATIEVTPAGGAAVTYTVQLAISAAAIEDWLTKAALDANTYFDLATFNGQPFISADLSTANGTNTLTFSVAAGGGVVTNVPNGEVVLTPNAAFPMGFTFTITGSGTLVDPDGAGVGAVTAGEAGAFTLADDNHAANTQTYDVVLDLAAYNSPVSADDLSATFGVETGVAVIDPANPTMITITGFTNLPDDPMVTGSVVLTPPPNTYAVMPANLQIPNPTGTAATNVDIGTFDIVTDDGITVAHRVIVAFREQLGTFQLRITSANIASSTGGADVDPADTYTISTNDVVTLKTDLTCTALAETFSVVLGGTENANYQARGLLTYYDRNALPTGSSMDANTVTLQQTAIIVATNNAGNEVANLPFQLVYPQCLPTHLGTDKTGADADTAYELSSAEHLETVSYFVNSAPSTYRDKYYKVVNDIDMEAVGLPWAASTAGSGFTPIAFTSEGTNAFSGTMDCDRNTITGLYINRPANNQVGLLGRVSAMIKDCYLEDVDIMGGDNVGGLVGDLYNGSVEDSYATGTVTGRDRVGGLVGNNEVAAIARAYGMVAVTGNASVGGLVGRMRLNSSIADSYATGDVIGRSTTVGGLVGNYLGSNINNSYATGRVTGLNRVGGLVGTITAGTSHISIINSYATGALEARYDILGGLLGDIPTQFFLTSIGVNLRLSSVYWNTSATQKLNNVERAVGDKRGVGDRASFSGVAGFSMTELQAATEPGLPGSDRVYSGWDGTIWDFATDGSRYPALLSVPCPNRQLNPEATECTSLAP